MNQHISNIRNYASQILAQKSSKCIKDQSLYEKLVYLQDLKNEDTYEIDEISIFEVLLQILDTGIVQLFVPTFDFFNQLILLNLTPKILPIVPTGSDQTYANIFVKRAYRILKDKAQTEVVQLSVITVLVALLNLDCQHVPISCFFAIINILFEIHRTSKSRINQSAIRAALTSCVMNTFHSSEDTQIKINKSPVRADSQSKDDETDNISQNDSECKSMNADMAHHETSQDTLSNQTVQEREFESKIFEDNDENNLMQAFDEYRLDWNDKKLIRAFCIFHHICKSTIVTNITDAATKLTAIPFVIFNMDLIVIALKSIELKTSTIHYFVELIKKYLFVSITQDLISSNEVLFRLSLEIFILLVEKFRSDLKCEIQHYFNCVLLSVIESSHCSFQTRHVFTTLVKLCSNAELMSFLFVNYDCDMESLNIFERLIGNICKNAENPSFLTDKNASLTQATKHDLEFKIRSSCLSLLNNILLFIKDVSESHKTVSIKSTQEIADEEAVKMSKISVSVFKERKDLLAQGVSLFNIKPKNGLEFLIANGFIEDSIEEIARFLKEEDRLNPDKIGELIGHENPKWIEVMNKYVENFNFKDMDFLEALRLFLSEFRLPGEAQKIDRLMEKFASHYCKENKNNEMFKNADTAYFVAYSIIMLTTDLHNPLVIRKITQQQYVMMNTNSDGTTNLPKDYLIKIYESIAANEITLRSKSVNNRSLVDFKEANLSFDLSKMTKMSLSRTWVSKNQVSKLEEVEQSDAVKTMFCTIWNQVMVCFGWVLNETNYSSLIYECLQGIRLSVRLACIYRLDFVRESLICSLIPFSIMNKKVKRIQDIQMKNVAVIKTILLIAKEDGQFLYNSWKDILPCISFMEFLQDVTSNKNKILNIKAPELDEISKSLSGFSLKSANFKSQFIYILEELSSQDLVVLMDQIFINSVKFDPEALMHLISCLCDAAKDELFQSKPPRIFSLQKFLEVMYYNMDRTRIIWKNMWLILQPFLIEVSCLDNENVSKFCLDSIRQLSYKLLERKELENFQYQSEFLRPFEHILIHSKFRSVKQLGVFCVNQLLNSHGSNIHSGWQTVLNILSFAAKEFDADCKETILDCLTIIVENYSEQTFKWMDSVLSLLTMISLSLEPDNINLRSTKLLLVYYDKTYNSKNFENDINDISDDFYCQKWNKGLKRIIESFVTIIKEGSPSIRADALVFLFNIFKLYPESIHPDKWVEIFEIFHDLLIFVFDESANFSSDFGIERVHHLSSAIIGGISEIYIKFFDQLPRSLSRSYFECLKIVAVIDNDIYKNNIHFVIKLLLENLYERLDDDHWKQVAEFIQYLFTKYTPDEFLDSSLIASRVTEAKSKHQGDDNIKLHFDYGSIDQDAHFIISGKQNSPNEYRTKILSQLSMCKFDIELLKTIESMISLSKLEPGSKVSSQIFLKMSQECFDAFFEIINNHRTVLMTLNTNEKHLTNIYSFIQDYIPEFKMVWNGVHPPSMAIQETMATICLLKFLCLHCFKNNFSDVCFEPFTQHIKSILERFPGLQNQCIDADLTHCLIENTLRLLTYTPDQFFESSIKILYSSIYPLIKIDMDARASDLLMQILQRLEKLIQLI
ncbi:Brefeldin A-inhibited guanine nucleotide-exchange protein 2 [Thelohanellus kitauei]|uniref:Brefeldin A-inhibited guanine nucleotide-exchange protein 2 n=1 Tax=Thelohanellus kitauei TaxID=669202 RepID=A0A0C2J2M2_THEKT|nr:Brefeldin A-inhibited guanine nucleotide-exchange protein 2 [Thelohanellus kitauei]